MHFDKFAFGSIQIDGSTYEHDVAVDRGEVRKRKKKPSKKFRDDFGYTPLSVKENIPWEMPPTRGRYRSIRPITDYEASETRGRTPQG